MPRSALTVAIALLTVPASPTRAEVVVPEGFECKLVASGISGATGMALLPDGRILLCEQPGTLRLVRNDALLPEPVLRVETDSFWERGLIGVAVHPRFSAGPWIYAHYNPDKPHVHHRISRFRMDGDRVLANSEQILFEGNDETKSGGGKPAGHQAGGLAFGPDGMLYFGFGEQTAEKPAQDMKSLLGKLFRIAPDGAIPDDNPFAKELTGKHRAIWALGLRNPYGLAFHPDNGRLFINEVGPDRPEEINQGRPGANYGWPIARGKAGDARFTDPIFISEPKEAKSYAGGAFYAGCEPQFPDEWRGKYLFLEYIYGWLGAIDPDKPDKIKKLATGFIMPVAVAVENDGSLLVLERAAWVRDQTYKPNTGRLWRITFNSKETEAPAKHAK
jgi:glucose/arabinose dehydrogenase